MLEAKFRPFFQKIFIEPVAQPLSQCVKANHVTFLSLLMGLFAAICIAIDWSVAAVVLLLLSGYLDIVDGSIARMSDQSSPFGTMLDILSDRLVEVLVVIGLVWRDPDLSMVGLLMMASMLLCISSFLVVGIFSNKASEKSFYYSPGLMERAEAFIFFIAMICFPAANFWLGCVFTLLVLWTAVVRLYEFRKMTLQMETKK